MQGKVFIVDDVRDYCEELSQALARDGHNVEFATSAADAIEGAIRMQPDILISDWMLEDHVHGLNIAEALSVAYPGLRTILMTGYASLDLRSDAERRGVVAFLEKPFPLSSIREAVKNSFNATLKREPTPAVGFMLLSEDGFISYANPSAVEIVQRAGMKMTEKFRQLFAEEYWDDLIKPSAGWVAAGPPGWRRPPWRLHMRKLGTELRSVVILHEDEALYLSGTPIVTRLLGLPDPFPSGFEYEGHVLIVDDLESIRQITAEVIRQTGGICLTAATHVEAMHLFAHDGKIAYVIIDYEMPDGPPVGLIERIKSLRPQVKIIGCSAAAHQQDFARLGVDRYLAKPWHMSDLLSVLSRTPEHASSGAFGG